MDEEELREKRESGDLHPADLKSAVSETLIQIFEPVRKRVDDLEK